MTLNPFAASGSRPGHGNITLAILPPSTPVLETLSFQYPLKLISPAALFLPNRTDEPILIHAVFLLTYGGGLVAGDIIELRVNLAAATRLVLLTQGSTKIFKSLDAVTVTRQTMTVDLARGSALCYLPDPVQPFHDSAFEQKQVYNVTEKSANLCVCDWVCEGRPARGEKWSFRSYTSRNEVWWTPPKEEKILMLRDNLILDSNAVGGIDISSRVDFLGCFGTLIVCGQLFSALGGYFLDEFKLLPRIGNKNWDRQGDDCTKTPREIARAVRIGQEQEDGVLWTAASTRGFVVVKFGAREVEGAKRWLDAMLREEGTVVAEFGERALHCYK